MEETHDRSQIIPIAHQKKVRHRKKQIFQNILSQMEFYFGDANLTKDRFLSNLIQHDPHVDLSVFLQFNKIRQLTDKVEDIASAIKNSSLLTLSEDGLKVYRNTPVRQREDIDDCTIYVERIPPDITHDGLIKIFSEFGNVQYVSIPKYKHNKMIKGFAFVEFDDADVATRCLEYFASIGCKLPSQMPPDKLYSIVTFEGNDKKEETDHNKSTESVENKEEIKHEDIKTDTDTVFNENETKNEDETNIRSTNLSKETDMDISVKSEETSMNKEIHVQKRKLSSEEDSKEKVKRLKTANNVDSKEENIKLETVTSDNNVVTTDEEKEANVTSEDVNKKRRKRKKTQKRVLNIKEMGLQILSKREWKRLRNKYLDLQRSRMTSLKQQLYRTRYGSNYNMYTNPNSTDSTQNQVSEKQPSEEIPNKPTEETKQLNFVPGTIVHLQLPESCVDIKKFKVELKTFSPEIKYIDVNEGSFDAYVRLSSADAAKQFVECTFPATMILLEGQLEIDYWKKADEDRKVKFNKVLKKPKQRGRYKLLRKAEKELGKHIRFDDAD